MPLRTVCSSRLTHSILATLLVGCGGSAHGEASVAADATSDVSQEAGPRVDSDAADASLAEAGATDSSDVGPPGVVVHVACAPPIDPTTGRLCVRLLPEAIAFSDDPVMDGKGALIVQVFGTPFPPKSGGELAPLQIFGVGLDGGTAKPVDLAMGSIDIEFGAVPPKVVYVRAIFLDDPSQIGGKAEDLKPGNWIGGIDLSSGLIEATPLLPITMIAGIGTGVPIDLLAMRALTVHVKVASGVHPRGDGQGKLTVVADDSPLLASDAGVRAFGFGSTPCANPLATEGATVHGIVIGKGPYFLVPSLDDFGLGGSFPAGAMASLQPTAKGYEVPPGNRIAFPSSAYAIEQTIELNFANAGDAQLDTLHCP